jgi:hypothetical protein
LDDAAWVASASEAARRELQALDALLSSTSGVPPLCSALVRTAYAIESLREALDGRPASSYEAFVQSQAEGGAGRAGAGIPIHVFWAASAPLAPPGGWPSVRAIGRERNALAAALEALAATEGLRRRRSFLAVGVVAALAAAAVGAALWLRRPPVWHVEYFRAANLTDPIANDVASDVGGHWGEGSPHSSVPADNFSARWQTCLVIDRPLDITFRLGSDDGSRLIVDGRTILDLWSSHPYAERDATASLAVGAHELKVEHFDSGGNADLTLVAQIGGKGPFVSLPRALLRIPAAGPTPCVR